MEPFVTGEDNHQKTIANFIDGFFLGICRTDADGRILYCNRKFAEILKTAPGELIGTRANDWYRNAVDSEALYCRLQNGETICEHPVTLQTAAGESCWCEMAAEAQCDGEGNLRYIDSCFEEIGPKTNNITPDGSLDQQRDHALVPRASNPKKQQQNFFQKAEKTPAHGQESVLQKEQRLQGVMEMARAISQRLAQPLTVINLLLGQIMAEAAGDTRNHIKFIRIGDQVDQLNEITEKIQKIRKYKTMEYVAGIRIIDLDQSG